MPMMLGLRSPWLGLAMAMTACQDPAQTPGETGDTGSTSTPGPMDTGSSGTPTTAGPSADSTGDNADSTGGTTWTTTTATTSDGSTTLVQSTTSDGSSSSGGESSSDSGTGSDTGMALDYDCDNLVQPFVSEMELDAPRGYHDVYFDDAGHILGFDGSSAIVQSTYGNALSVFLPGIASTPQGMDVLDSDLVYVNSSGELRRVTPALQTSVVATGFFGGYGVTIGPDLQVYVGFDDTIARVDPETGTWEVFATLPVTARVVVFNLDSTGVYISTIGNGDVYYVPVDAELLPTAAPTVFASNVGDSWHDGITIDACGNLYVPEFWSSGLYRIDPDGVVTTLYDEFSASFEHYGHGLEFGSGIGGWNDRAVYLPQPYQGNTVNEVVLGVPSGASVRTWAQ